MYKVAISSQKQMQSKLLVHFKNLEQHFFLMFPLLHILKRFPLFQIEFNKNASKTLILL